MFYIITNLDWIIRRLGFFVIVGADFEALDDQGNTALLHAAAHGHYNVVIFLGKCGADFSHRNDIGKSVWDFGMEQSNSDLLKVSYSVQQFSTLRSSVFHMHIIRFPYLDILSTV